jgi:hypothetical protein
VKRAPDIDADQPLSRQQELAFAAHYGTPRYWYGPLLWGAAAYPMSPAGAAAASSLAPGSASAQRAAEERLAQADPHLRSGAGVTGYDVEARDGPLGQVDDFELDGESWAITGIIVDTKKWWPGGLVRIAPGDVESIDWHTRKMHLRLSRDEAKAAQAR